MSFKYRPEIDGLRSIAVLPVIFFHAGFTGFSGGFVGVDIFFVISGYLITSLIIGELKLGEFSLIGFYERRARRILPALFLVIICSLPFAWAWMLPPELRDFGQSIVTVLLFVSNFLFFQDAGYFGPSTELIPLIHTWSLAVEEQFYVLFPLLLLAVYRFGSQSVVIVISFMAMLSLLLSGFFSASMPDFAFYLLPARAWELLLGALTALYLSSERVAQPTMLVQNGLSALGLVMIGFAVFTFDESTVFPGWSALIPVIGTVLIVLFGNVGTFVNRMLSLKGFVSIGLISYSTYL